MNSLKQDFKNSWIKSDNYGFRIIAINVSVFILYQIVQLFSFFSGQTENSLLFYLFDESFLLPADLNHFIIRPWTLITYFFTHQGFFHILFNMLFIYWFGRILSDLIGGKKLLSIYIWGGIAGGLVYLLIYNLVSVYNSESSRLLGASAGVYAIVVGAATLRPSYKIYLLFLGPVKISYIALFYVLISFFAIKGSNAGGNLAHLGGALMGFIFIKELQRGRDLGSPIFKFFSWLQQFKYPIQKKPRFKIIKNKKNDIEKDVNFTSTSSPKPSYKPKRAHHFYNQQEIDAILDKISKSGYANLTKKEKDILMYTSKRKDK